MLPVGIEPKTLEYNAVTLTNTTRRSPVTVQKYWLVVVEGRGFWKERLGYNNTSISYNVLVIL